jgi:glycosyltransferase involved in cell wall biosynthesis
MCCQTNNHLTVKQKILVSVLMATFNTDFTLVKRAIDSALTQRFQDFELIIIDDGSHNDTQAKLLQYATEHEDKIIYLRQANSGQSQAINRGILNSVGEFITILDADDEYKPDHLDACLQQMTDADLIASTTETIVDTDDDYYVPDVHDNSRLIHVDECILFATLFGRKKVFQDMKFQHKYGADTSFYEHASQRYRVKKVDLRTYIYYRNNPDSICSTVKRQNTAVYA